MPSSRPIRRTSKATSSRPTTSPRHLRIGCEARRRETRFVGTAVPNFFRKPYGPGWALVGDAGYNKDFITAQGINDAFRDAELCATRIGRSIRRHSLLRRRDGRLPITLATRRCCRCIEFTAELATLEPPPPELQQLLAAIAGNQDAMDGFAQVNGGVTSPAEFFSPANVARMMSVESALR